MTMMAGLNAALRVLFFICKLILGSAALLLMVLLAAIDIATDYAKPILVFIAGLVCVAVFSLIQSTAYDGMLSVIGASLGSVLITLFLAVVYCKCGFHLAKRGLKILDWLFIGMTLSLMGCFQALGFDPLTWAAFIVTPLLIARVIINWLLHGRRGKGNGEK